MQKSNNKEVNRTETKLTGLTINLKRDIQKLFFKSINKTPKSIKTFSTVDNLILNSIYQQLKSQKMMLQKIYKKMS